MKLFRWLLTLLFLTSLQSGGAIGPNVPKGNRKVPASYSSHQSTDKVKKIEADKGSIKDLKVANLDVKKEKNTIGKTYTIGVDFPTIQAGIDLVNSGLKPDKNVTLVIPRGTYHESLFIDTDLSDPTINDPSTDLLFTKGRGLRLIGDTRPIAAMTYMNGGIVSTDPTFLVNSGQNSLGTLNSVVSLSNSGNTLTVTNTPGPQPNFGACGVVAGDVIIVSDDDGTFQQRNVLTVAANNVTYDGSPVTISGKGAAITFCPNVQVMAENPDLICLVASGNVEMVGIWFSMDPCFASSSIYPLYIQWTGRVFASGILSDARFVNSMGAIITFEGGQLDVSVADQNIQGHVTALGGSVSLGPNSYIGQNGSWYVLARPRQGSGCVLNLNNSAFSAAALQVNGADVTAEGYFLGEQSAAHLTNFLAFNCTVGMDVHAQSRAYCAGLLQLDTCTIGVALNNGYMINSGDGTFAGLTPTISNCVTAIQATLGGQFLTSRPLAIDSCFAGVNLTAASLFSSTDSVTFTSVLESYAIDEGSIYNTDTNEGTDPSLSNIFTYSNPGGQVMNSAYLHQLLDSSGAITLRLFPGKIAAATPVYQGKIYTLTSISSAPHQLTLAPSSTFLDGTSSKTFSGGVGSTMTIEIISASQVAILTSSGVT